MKKDRPGFFKTACQIDTILLSYGLAILLMVVVFACVLERMGKTPERYRRFSESIGERLKGAPSLGLARKGMAFSGLNLFKFQLQGQVELHHLGKKIKIKSVANGLVVRIPSDFLFSGLALSLRPEAEAFVDGFAQLLKGAQVKVAVAGFTDDVDVLTPLFSSNWDLSALRASAVLKALVSRGISGQRLAVEAYGDQRPLASGKTPKARSMNRRIEILIKP